MKAVRIDAFCAADSVRVSDAPKPEPAPGEVRLRIAYAGVNPVDWKICQGAMAAVFPHQFPLTLGWDAAGEIDQVGEGVSRLAPGQRVMGYCRQYGTPVERGTYAEYICVPESLLVPIPDSLALMSAAALPLPFLTAWQALVQAGGLQAGETVAIVGAAGGVGSMAVQLARLQGARVIAYSRPANHSYVKGLGAEIALDYQALFDPSPVLETRPDLLLDCSGGEALAAGLERVRTGGRLVSIAGQPDAGRAEALGVRAQRIVAKADQAQLEHLARLCAEGRLQLPEIDVMPLASVAEALGRSRQGTVRGKLVLEVARLCWQDQVIV
ncbi:NADP-dependent oxidoreductase [Zoogloea dura]|jgi:NADPH:quinone reductase-like Zn-dependent oxidoreductase|uniref:NADP-dependent oxidoreductase n=1 Tax=Zoogloea dura TaxID=2728840 RepID=A0A848GC47_9RHOO|nr:NADP-dependent oxidoreductase [Zoogloea dura]NML27973.1 NADP-dependent oxidoreductase [Zoogloea dura]